jgi:hypothetical protein
MTYSQWAEKVGLRDFIRERDEQTKAAKAAEKARVKSEKQLAKEIAQAEKASREAQKIAQGTTDAYIDSGEIKLTPITPRAHASTGRDDSGYYPDELPGEYIDEAGGTGYFPDEEPVEYSYDFGKYGILTSNVNITLDFEEVSNHALSRLEERGLTLSDINYIIKNGKTLRQSLDKYLYVTPRGAAVVLSNGKLITAYGRKEFTDSFIGDIIRRLFDYDD